MKTRIRNIIHSLIRSLPDPTQELIFDESVKILSRRGGYQERLEKYYWDEGSRYWSSFAKPLRPSRDDISRYRSYLKEAIALPYAPKVLLLGATPELRDVLAEFYQTAQVYIIDFSAAMFMMTSKKLRVANADRELWIKTNWMDTRLPENFFDVIIGDLILQQFPAPSISDALTRIAQLLKTNGTFIFRGRIAKETLSGRNVAEVVNEVIQSSYENEHEGAFTLIWKLRDAHMHLPATSVPDRDSIIVCDLEKLLHEKNIPAFITLAHRYLSLGAKRFPFRSFHAAMSAEDFPTLLLRAFVVEKRGHASDYHDSEYFPLFLCRKKNSEIQSTNDTT